MARTIYDGTLDGTFTGFDADQLFKMANGTYWVQDRYKYWYHYAYRPAAQILEDRHTYTLAVAGRSIPVRPAGEVVESTIDGTFKGWNGNSRYRLSNGQVWEQSAYKYEYMYAYRPLAVVYRPHGSHVMLVEGTTAEVRRVE